MKKLILIFIFSLLISIPVILPFFHAGYFPTHDGEWAVVRAVEMFREVRDLQFPPRYSGALNFGYGYPLFNFVYPMPYYLTTFLHFLQVGFVDSVKLSFAASVVFSALFMFLAAQRFWQSTLAGAVAAMLYIYFPYRMVDLYVRGSIGESVAFMLFPLLFYLLLVVHETKNRFAVAAASFAFAALVLSHNIMTVYFVPILVVFVGSLIYFKKEKVWPYISFFLLGASLSAYFWFPAIVEKQYISLSQIPIADRSLYFVTLEQLLVSRWGYGTPTDANGFSYQLGIAHILAVLLLIVFFIRNFKEIRTVQFRISIMLASVGFVLFLLLFPFTSSIWSNTPLLKEINYPWTLLGPIGFLIAFLSGYLTVQKNIKYIAVILILVAIMQVLPYAGPKDYVNRGDSFYMTNEATTTSSDELMPIWVKEKPRSRFKDKVEIKSGRASINIMESNSIRSKFNVEAQEPSLIVVNTIYFPGWEIKADGKAVAFAYDNPKGVMEFNLPKGKYTIDVIFTETPLRVLSNTLSIFGLVVIFLIWRKRLLLV